MRVVSCGRGGSVGVWTLLAIWSVSALIALPGLAVSPILGRLSSVFEGTSELELQMLTSIPSLMIIPFVLLSGRLSDSRNKVGVLAVGLVIFLISGIGCFFAQTMWQFIAINCLLGVGAGIVIPLSTGLIVEFFRGKYRTKQLGLSSAISNLTLVGATMLAGWLATINWHLPFLVYLFPVVALALLPFLREGYVGEVRKTTNIFATKGFSVVQRGQMINKRAIMGIMVLYFVATYLTMIVVLDLSFIMKHHQMNSVESGWLISLFFLAIMLPGFFLNWVVERLGDYTIAVTFGLMAIGLVLVVVTNSVVVMAIGLVLAGGGYGVLQPVMYDKTPFTAVRSKGVMAMSLVMSVNYLAIFLAPFMVSGVMWLSPYRGADVPFYVNAIVALIFAVIAITFKRRFIFSSNRV